MAAAKSLAAQISHIKYAQVFDEAMPFMARDAKVSLFSPLLPHKVEAGMTFLCVQN